MIKVWSDDAWDDQGNKSNIKKIKNLIKYIDSTPFSGIEKPEPLKHDLSGKLSRRIIDENRLIYKVENETIYFYSAENHY